MKQYYFKTQFAASGDRVDIPRAKEANGSISYTQGWGEDYQKDLATEATAKPVSREATNQLFWALTGAVQQYQQRGFPEWISASDNGGGAFPYPAGSTVYHKNSYWVSLAGNNTSEPGDDDTWQGIVYRVAGKAVIAAGTDWRTIVTPAALKIDSDQRIATVNTSISNLSKTVSANKTATDSAISDLTKTVTANKTAADTAISNLSKTVSDNKTATDSAISNLSKTVSANKTAADNAIAATNAHTINGKRLDSDPVLSAGDVKAIPLTGTNQQTGTIEGKKGTGVQFIPDNYSNFDQKYAAVLQQGNNGYWRDNNTGFTIQWGIVDTKHNNDYTTINFARPFTACFSVNVDVFGSQGTTQDSSKNPIIKQWDGTSFTVYAGQVETQMCYQAFGIS